MSSTFGRTWAGGVEKRATNSKTWLYDENKHPITPNSPNTSRYHHFLSHFQHKHDSESTSSTHNVLNPLLAGIRGAEDALEGYEKDVGFFYSAECSSLLSIIDPPLHLDLDKRQVALSNKQHWDNLLQCLLGPPESKDIHGDAPSLTSSPSSSRIWMDCATDSEQSVGSDPVPLTPKADNWLYAHVAVKGSPDVLPSRPLNASASSFVPKIVSSPAISRSSSPLSLVGTPSPSMNSSTQSLPPTLTKDENGFYVSLSNPRSHSASTTPSPSMHTVLPPFLVEKPSRRSSKTRAIVDRLRSLNHNQDPRSTRSFDEQDLDIFTRTVPGPADSDVDSQSSLSTPGVDDDDSGDGWIRSTEANAKAKAHRTQNLVRALDRGRADSGENKEKGVNLSQSFPSLSTNHSTTKEGWMHIPPPPLPTRPGQRHGRNLSLGQLSLGPLSSAPPGGVFVLPPPYVPNQPYSPYTAAYAQMQMQMQMQAQMSAQARWYRPLHAARPYVPAASAQHQRSLSASEKGGVPRTIW